jgi:hypothetical protein
MATLFPVNIDDVLQIRIIQAYQGSIIMNTLHYQRFSSPVTLTGEDEMNAAIDDIQVATLGVRDRMRSMQSNAVSHERIQAQIVYPTRRPVIEQIDIQPGNIALSGMPSNVAAVFTKRGNHAYKGNTGSFHLAGFPTNYVNGPNLTAALITDLSGLANECTLDLPAFNGAPAWSAVIAPPTTAHNFNKPFSSFTVQSTVRVMRRRTLHVGI